MVKGGPWSGQAVLPPHQQGSVIPMPCPNLSHCQQPLGTSIPIPIPCSSLPEQSLPVNLLAVGGNSWS